MDKAYQGKTDKGTWEQFMWDSSIAPFEDPTPENTGYEEVEEVGVSTI